MDVWLSHLFTDRLILGKRIGWSSGLGGKTRPAQLCFAQSNHSGAVQREEHVPSVVDGTSPSEREGRHH